MKFWAIVLAAGSSRRFTHGNPQLSPKQFITYKNDPLYWESIKIFSAIPSICGITIALPETYFLLESERIRTRSWGLPVHAVIGGNSRVESMSNALKTITSPEKYILIHDAARPFFTPQLIQKLCNTLMENSNIHGVVPTLPLSDTIKEVTDNYVVHTPQRSSYHFVQTPQLFIKESLEQSLYCFLESHSYVAEITDDAMLLERAGFTIMTCSGEEKNKKITYTEDLIMVEETALKKYSRTLMGYDVHAYTKEEGARDFILGGIAIDTTYKLKAHSDGDVLLHAIIDALLPILGEGDIGQVFPNTKKEYDGISSAVLLTEIMKKIDDLDITLLHIDTTIVAQLPVISPYIKRIKENIAYLLGLATTNVSIKATTEESLGFTGEKRGIKAYALVTFL
ncbi:MAG: 2-C-methyl-D-erythritol 2,4-cyclodiphosphate synthase [Desulfovibrionaceae bacterium]